MFSIVYILFNLLSFTSLISIMDDLYERLNLEELRLECTNREIMYGPKDGKRNLISRLKVYDKNEAALAEVNESVQFESTVKEGATSGFLNFKEQMELLQFQREMKREDEERKIREEERLRKIKDEEAEREIRLLENRLRLEMAQKKLNEERKESVLEDTQKEHVRPKFLKVREMREGEDIEDYLRIFEMTAKAQFIPKEEWLGNLVPKLSEKAKSIYLEIPEGQSQNFDVAKNIIFEAYQHTADYYRYNFRNSEKGLEEDFVQWNNRTRRYLDRWMRVAGATGSSELILEQILIEKMLDSVSPELRSWLIEKKPETSGQMARLANEHIQAKKGPLVDGKYVGYSKKSPLGKSKTVAMETPTKSINTDSSTDGNASTRAKDKTDIRCFKCRKSGHLSYDCKEKKRNTTTGLLCMSSHEELQDKGFEHHFIKGNIGGKDAKMLVDSGCTRTLVHQKYVSDVEKTGEQMSVLTANGEKLTVPLAWVDITSPRGCQRELVGIMDSLPVDILLGRSSYGQTLTKEDVLAQWEDATMSDVIDNAFVLTRQQSKLQRAQARREEQIDRESTAAVKHLTPPPSKGAVSQLDEVSITNDVNEVSDQSESQEQSREDIFRVQRHLLDRNRDQLVEDQKNDCTLGDIYDSAHVTPSQSVD